MRQCPPEVEARAVQLPPLVLPAVVAASLALAIAGLFSGAGAREQSQVLEDEVSWFQHSLTLHRKKTLNRQERSRLAVPGNNEVISDRFCAGGQRLPSLYVLGAQKSATTSVAQDLIAAGVQAALQRGPPAEDLTGGCWDQEGHRSPGSPQGNCWAKEFHFWDQHAFSRMDDAEILTEWRQSLPNCTDYWRPVGDFTPNNLRLTPLPSTTSPTGFHYSSWYSEYAPSASASLPKTLSSLYGSFAGSRLLFVVFLREPIARMQSAFYHAQEHHFRAVCSDCQASSFQVALARALTKARQATPVFEDWLWTSLYARHLTEWLAYFDPRQFIAVPFHVYTAHGFNGLCWDISSRIDFDMKCGRFGYINATRANTHAHEHLDADAPRTHLEAAKEFFKTENVHLVKLLTEARLSGMVLQGLGRSRSEFRVADWLLQHW